MVKVFFYVLVFFIIVLLLSPISQAQDCSANSTIHDDSCVQVKVYSKNKQALVDMVVYLEPLSGQVLTPSISPLVISQKDKAFSPYISIIQANQEIQFTNQDDITHHIYSVSQGNKFSFKIRAGQSNANTRFEHSSEVAMGCNIHDWMSGYLLVVDTPYFTKTNQQGIANFANIQQGKYRVVVWHPQMKTSNNRLIVEKNINGNALFSVSLTAELEKLPVQESDDDFDFLSDY